MIDEATARRERLRDWLFLVRAPGIGAVTLQALFERFGSARAIREADPHALADCPFLGPRQRRALRAPVDAAAVDRDLDWAGMDGHDCLTLEDPRYPRLLAEIPAPPPVLFVRGRVESLSRPQLAVVGSRHPSPDGRVMARDFAAALVGSGLAVTSGLAYGIDAAAHVGALDAGGVTIAVLGSGLASVYPARHRRLADAIAEHGAVVSEHSPWSRPRPEHFPRRNRIISGLSLGVLVVEATPRSGSLTTAGHAADQGRELFAIPGSIMNPLARGCHRLIRQGGKLTETIDDIVEELAPLAAVGWKAAGGPLSGDPPPDDRQAARLLEWIGHAPVSVDELVARSGWPAARVSAAVALLEVENRVISLPGGRYLRSHRSTKTVNR